MRAPQVAYDNGSGENIYDVHTDHLDTPRMLTDATGTPVWRASYEAYGEAALDQDPDGDLTEVTFNVRFPGQYFDAESGMHYNRFRHYSPELGRYVSADPIGQFQIIADNVSADPIRDLNLAWGNSTGPDRRLDAGSSNLYEYAMSSPLVMTDPTGEVVACGRYFLNGYWVCIPITDDPDLEDDTGIYEFFPPGDMSIPEDDPSHGFSCSAFGFCLIPDDKFKDLLEGPDPNSC